MADVEMNKGVQILLERMSSNPNEFIPTLREGYPAKWRDILISIEMRTNGGKEYKDQLPFLNDKEIKVLWDKMQSLQGELFTKRVMDTLLRDAHDYERFETIKQLPLLLKELEKHSPAELSLLSRRVTGGSPKGKN
jgi:hypothetical protein|tara:strand:+ start:3629 stop:4036 length:408 start_codon:yes stop_codon:yes gene_type:complete